MAAPTAYATEDEFATYLHGVLGDDDVARQLGWSVTGGDYGEAIDEALLRLGADAITEFSGRQEMRKLRAVGRRELWRLVAQRTAGNHDSETEGGTTSYSQVHKQAVTMFKIADAEMVEVLAAADASGDRVLPTFFTTAAGTRGK